jgi:Tfp pilus assembly protein PilF
MKLSYIFNIILVIICLVNTSCSIQKKRAIRQEKKTACVVLEEKIKKAEQYYQNGELEMALQAMNNINEKISGKCNDTYETALILISKIQLLLEDKSAEYTYKELLKLTL